MKCVKSGLKHLNRRQFNDISNRVLEEKEQLNVVQRSLRDHPLDGELIKLNKKVTDEYADLLVAEESFYKDKSRVQRLNVGDKNRKVKEHNASNRILSLVDDNRERI